MPPDQPQQQPLPGQYQPGYGPPPGYPQPGYGPPGYPAQPVQQPPAYGPPPGAGWNAAGYGPPPRKKHTGRYVAIWLGGGAVLLILAVAFGQSGSDGRSGSQGSGAGVAAAGPAPGPNPHAVARDGDFAFRFTGMTCGAAAARRVYGTPDLTGHLPSGTVECLVRLHVTDDKSEAQTFYDSNQYAVDSQGHQLTADDNGIFMTGDKDGTQLNPGVSLTALIPYNLPAGDQVTGLVLHDSEFSGGVTVRF